MAERNAKKEDEVVKKNTQYRYRADDYTYRRRRTDTLAAKSKADDCGIKEGTADHWYISSRRIRYGYERQKNLHDPIPTKIPEHNVLKARTRLDLEVLDVLSDELWMWW
ncbi:hypothetical protein U1Q18_050942 [Sarracenia purpurea var. burkii]